MPIGMAAMASGSLMIVSGRTDDRFQSWQDFSNFSVMPLEQGKVIELIEMTKFEQTSKTKFIRLLKDRSFFQQHRSFLSRPLLALMMLMTFDQFASIPEKIYIFYDQAFETLFAKHDATKEAFKRRMHSDLPMDVFKNHLASFCIASYVDTKVEFTHAEVLEYVKKAIGMQNSSTDAACFLRDLLESVCILQKEGTSYVFSHRTFQEFFAAYWLARVSPSYIPRLVPMLALRHSDSVIKMLFDMNQDVLEKELIVPNLNRIALSTLEPDQAEFLVDWIRYFKMQISVNVRSERDCALYRDRKAFRRPISSVQLKYASLKCDRVQFKLRSAPSSRNPFARQTFPNHLPVFASK